MPTCEPRCDVTRRYVTRNDVGDGDGDGHDVTDDEDKEDDEDDGSAARNRGVHVSHGEDLPTDLSSRARE